MRITAPDFTVDTTPDVAGFLLITAVITATFLIGVLCIARAASSRSKVYGSIGALALVATVALVPALAASSNPKTTAADQLVAHVASIGGAVITIAEADQLLEELAETGQVSLHREDGPPLIVTGWSKKAPPWR